MRGVAGPESTRRRARRQLLCVAVLATLKATSAGAQTIGGIETNGDCPSEASLSASLATRRLPEEARSFKLVLHGFAGGTDVSLLEPSGQSVAERRLVSQDCNALADAAALIVEAYFVELAARAAAGPTENGANAATPTGNEGVPAPASSVPAVPPPPRVDVSSARPEPDAAPPGPPPRFTVGASLGVLLYPQSAEAAPTAQLAFGLLLGDALELQMHAHFAGSTTFNAPPDSVSRQELGAAARAVGWFGQQPTFGLWGGVGASLASVELIDLQNAPLRTVWSPVVEAGLAGAVRVGGLFSLQAELGCRVYLIEENYVVDPGAQPISDGPRFSCSLLTGPVLTTGRRK